MSASDTFDLSTPLGTQPTAARRTSLTKAQKAALVGAGGAAILSGSALAWGMSKNGSLNPFAPEVPAGSNEPDVDGELPDGVPPVDAADPTVSTAMPADSTSVAAPGPVGTLTAMEPQEPNPAPEPTGTGEPVPTAPVSAAEGVSAGTGFEQAFAEARQEVGPGGYFVWNGNAYNTFFKEEWEAMSPAEQQEYAAAVREDQLESWQQGQAQIQDVTIDDSGTNVVFGDANASEVVPDEPAEPTNAEWIAVNVDGHRVDLGNTDDDDTAELAILDGQVALVDVNDDGTFDVGGRIDPETGRVTEWVELEKPIDAPSLGDVRGTEEADPAKPQYTSGESGDFGDDFDNQAGTSDFV